MNNRKVRIQRSIIAALMLYYIFRCIELALTIRIGISPDEKYYFDVIRFFSVSPLLPWNWTEDITYGLLKTTPSLYQMLMGGILKLSPWAGTDLVVLRLANLVFSIVNIIFTFKIVTFITKSRLIRIFSLVVITNIPMFTFLSSSVSQDNLTNMFGTISIFFLLKTLRQFSLENILPLLLTMLLGLLTSITYIPLAFVIAFLLSARIYNLRRVIFNQHWNWKDWRMKKAYIFYIFSIVLALISTLNLYGTNIIKYRSLIPECEMKYEESYCSRMNTQKPYAIIAEEESIIEERVNPYDYFRIWYKETLTRSVGILGHESILKPSKLNVPYEFMMLLCIFVMIRDFSLKNKLMSISVFVVLFYCLFLAFIQNYNTYLNLGLLTSTIQGKNVFLILGPLVALFSNSLATLSSKRPIKYIIVFMAIMTFMLGDYLYFKREVPNNWYSGSQLANLVIEVNQSIR